MFGRLITIIYTLNLLNHNQETTMKKKYCIYQLVTKRVCLPSTNYYARDNDWDAEDITILVFIAEYDTESRAEYELSELGIKDCCIIPVYN